MKIALLLAVFLWVLSAVLVLVAPAPVVDLGNPSVSPTVVKPGERIEVTRNIRILKPDSLRVVRTMVKGDCKKACDIVDLHGGALTLATGDHMNLRRYHVIPVTVSEGKWRLAFSVHWDDLIGRDRHIKLKELEIEVVR